MKIRASLFSGYAKSSQHVQVSSSSQHFLNVNTKITYYRISNNKKNPRLWGGLIFETPRTRRVGKKCYCRGRTRRIPVCASTLRTIMARFYMIVASSRTLLPRCHAANYGSEHRYLIRLFREGETIERGPASQPASQHTNRKLRQTSGRLDETAERHETEGKRKWQGLSEGALPPSPLSK